MSRIVGGWKHHGSILANITWRLFLHYNLIDSFEQSGGEKGSFVSLLQNVEKDVLSNRYDLIFVHSLATHSPYGFDLNCDYDGEKYITYRHLSYEKKIEGQNIDRFCTLKFMEKSLKNIIQKNNEKKIQFFILSDHGTRLKEDKDSYLKTIFIHRNFAKNFKENNSETTIQKIFVDIFKN